MKSILDVAVMSKVLVICAALVLLGAGTVVNAQDWMNDPPRFEDGWIFLGTADRDDEKIILTKDGDEEIGAAFMEDTMSFKADFEMEFTAYFGENDDGGGDGIFLMFIGGEMPDALFTGSSVFVVGWETIPHDRTKDDIADFEDPDADAFVLGDINLDAPEVYVEIDNIEDDEEHEVRITWDSSETMMSVFIDDMDEAFYVYTGDICADSLDGNYEVTVGFMGASDLGHNRQYIIPVEE